MSVSSSKTEALHFSVHGDFLTNLFREELLEGDPEKTLGRLMQSLIGFDLGHARSILRGEKKLVGINNLDLKKDKGYTDKEMRRLCYIYRDDRCVPGIFLEAECKKWMDQFPPKEPEYVPIAVRRAGGDLATMLRESRQSPVETFIRQMKSEDMEDLYEEATAPPVPYENFTPDDADHFGWLISPEGLLYKIPFQKHGDWFVKYAKYIDPKGVIFDEYGEGNPCKDHGWIRFSGGPGLGMVVDLSKNKELRPPKHAISRHMRRYAGHQFTISDDSRHVFEINIDFERAMRLLNESYQ